MITGFHRSRNVKAPARASSMEMGEEGGGRDDREKGSFLETWLKYLLLFEQNNDSHRI